MDECTVQEAIDGFLVAQTLDEDVAIVENSMFHALKKALERTED